MLDIIHSICLLILAGSVAHAARSMHHMIQAFQHTQRSHRALVDALIHRDLSGFPEEEPSK